LAQRIVLHLRRSKMSRNSIIGSLNLAALTTNGGFLGCAAALLTGPVW